MLSIALPFRWVSLFGGSPTGLAILCIPMLMWGLDAAVRKERIGGGLMAAAAIMTAYWNDGHVFFFTTLLSPAWAFVVLLHRDDMEYKNPRRV